MVEAQPENNTAAENPEGQEQADDQQDAQEECENELD